MVGLGGKGSGDAQPKSRRHLKGWFSDLKSELSSHSKDKDKSSGSNSSPANSTERQSEIVTKAASDAKLRQEQASSIVIPKATENGKLLDKGQGASSDATVNLTSHTQEVEHAKPVVGAPDTSQKALSSKTPTLPPISELWNLAYDELRETEAKLVKEYEIALSKNLSAMVGSTVVLSGSSVGRREQMATILGGKMDEVKKNTWKLKFGDNEVPVKDLMEPVVGMVDWANDYITGAVSANPYASIAWAGVGLLLPVS
jgi:N-terminal domain of NWD NACHT-NTPase